MWCVSVTCKEEIPDGSAFCPFCVAPQSAAPTYRAPAPAVAPVSADVDFDALAGTIHNAGDRLAADAWKKADALVGLNALAWSDPRWLAESPKYVPESTERMTRLGTFELQIDTGRTTWSPTLPALLPLFGRAHLFIQSAPPAHSTARGLLQSVALRMLAAVPAGRLRMTLIDPVGLGQNVSTLLELNENVRGRAAWADPRTINEALSELVGNMSMIFQTRLKNEYADVEAFNRSAGAEAEPYRVIVISDFPNGFNDEGLGLLQSIAEKGPKAGTYLLVMWDTSKAMRRDFRAESLTSTGWLIGAGTPGALTLQAPGLTDVALKPDAPPAKEIVKRLTAVVNKGADAAKDVRIPLKNCLPEQLWAESTVDRLEVPIGHRGVERQMFVLGSGTRHHALTGGMTGSGKSVLLHAIILSLCHHYSPEEFQLYLVDFKQGVEFQHYRELPHAKVVAIESEREFGVSVLRGLRAQMDRRGEDFRERGSQNIAAFRNATQQKLPRILLVIDEFQLFFERKDRLAIEAAQLIEQLARQGRSAGIHVLLATQSMPSDAIDPGTLGQFGVRIVLQMAKDVPNRILAQDNHSAASLERPGQAIYNDGGGMVGSDKRFQVAFVPDGGHVEYVNALANEARRRGIFKAPMVFEGNKPAMLERNAALMAVVRAGPPATPPRPLRLYLGEPVHVVEEHVAFKLRRQEGSNLLIVGKDEEAAAAMLLSAVFSASRWFSPDKLAVRVLDLTKEESPVHGKLEALEHAVRDFQYGLRGRITTTLNSVHQELETRLAMEARGERITAGPMLLVIAGLHAAPRLRKEGIKYPPEGVQFQKILVEGPNVGVHLMVWIDQYSQLQAVLESRQIQEFHTRVALLGSEIDKVVPGVGSNASLRKNYGYFVDTEDGDEPEKLRTYGDVLNQITASRA
jgi:S-DNA-T family DNA segregation ATPase FtsK/SpoIIIE